MLSSVRLSVRSRHRRTWRNLRMVMRREQHHRDADHSTVADIVATVDRTLIALRAPDLAPRFYPILSSAVPLDLPGWVVAATGAGAEPSA